jgi:uncharacterized protein YjiS (DUF1127 family)
MRDYILHEAHSRLAYGRLTGVVRMLCNWRMRKNLKRLRGLSAFHLNDIGLNRLELDKLIAMPLTHDHVWNSDCAAAAKTTITHIGPQFLALLFLRRATLFLSGVFYQKIHRGTLAA